MFGRCVVEYLLVNILLQTSVILSEAFTTLYMYYRVNTINVSKKGKARLNIVWMLVIYVH